MSNEKSPIYLNAKSNRFIWKDIEDIWVSQQSGYSCLITALRILLRYYNADFSEEELEKLIKAENFETFDFGTYLPIIGAVALKFGLGVVYRSVTAKKHPDAPLIITSEEIVRKMIHDDMDETEEKQSILFAYKAFLTILDNNGKICLHSPCSPPSIHDILNALTKGPVIVLVSAKEYYRINEEWFHALVFVPNKNNGFTLLDGFKRMGYECYPKWERHLAFATEYDWSKWKGGMLEFEAKGNI